jgi:hypothetical protein
MIKHKWFVLGALSNLVALLVGLGIGYILRPSISVHAETGMKTEEVQPMISGGTAAFGILLVHQAEADTLVVNGYDVLKIDQGILNYLSTRPLAEKADIDKIVNESRPDIIYKIKSPPEPASPAPGKEPSK